MKTNKRSRWVDWSIILGASLLALLLTKSILKDITSLELFRPIEKKVDFKMSDIYNTVEKSRAAIPLSQDVLIVSVDSCDRAGVIETIHTIASLQPKAIGLDIYFAVPQENNDALMEMVFNTENLVSVMRVGTFDGGETYDRVPLSFYDAYVQPPHTGFVNMDASYPWNVVRTFVPYVMTSDGDTLPGMAMALAQIADPQRAGQLAARGRTKEIIDFSSCEIEIVSAGQLMQADVAERVYDKVVIVGDIHDIKDCYLTPLHEPQAGVVIHAYMLQTILSGSYIRTSPVWVDWMIAIPICLLFIILMQLSKSHMSYWGSLILRLSQFGIMYGLVWCGCRIFADWHVYVDFAPATVMLGLASLACDLLSASYEIIKSSIHHIQIYYSKRKAS